MTFGPEVKDPNATLNYSIDWSDSLPAETIGTSVWSCSPTGTGITVGTGSIASLSTTTSFGGGTAGCVYDLMNKVYTNSGIVDERGITIRVENL